MARIRSRRAGNSLEVVISGRLTSLDMRRLEHVCAGALTSADPKLDIDLGAVTYTDATARAILQRLETRGIRLRSATRTGFPHPVLRECHDSARTNAPFNRAATAGARTSPRLLVR
jgi:hypothetical protein